MQMDRFNRWASNVPCATQRSTTHLRRASGIGWTAGLNRDLNVGAIVALAPNLTVLTNLLGVDFKTVQSVLNESVAG